MHTGPRFNIRDQFLLRMAYTTKGLVAGLFWPRWWRHWGVVFLNHYLALVLPGAMVSKVLRCEDENRLFVLAIENE